MESTLSAAAGIGLRAPHVGHVLGTLPRVAWFEVHSENYFVDGGPMLDALLRIREQYPISLHGVGMSLGSADSLDRTHLAKLRRLIARVEPSIVSEHLCWSGVGGRHLNDLLPLPYTEEALAHVCARVREAQDLLGRPLAIENISSYVTFPESSMPESTFVSAVVDGAGCRLLLDINNLYVNSVNHRFDADAFLAAMPGDAISEFHLAGFDASGPCLIDTHGAPVDLAVWALYERAVDRFGPRPTLIEWDTDLPRFDVLQREAHIAQTILEARDAAAA
jgi:uncharacterized protein (UPF0276 family)